MSKKHIMSYDEALSLLGLKRSTARSRKAVLAAYAQTHRRYTNALNAAITPEMRERAAAAVSLAHEAKKICLDDVSSRSQPTTKTKSSSTSTRHTSSGTGTGGRIRDFFQTVWDVASAILKAIRILITSTGKLFRFLAEVTRELEAAGIPKAVTILVFVVVILIVMNGCNQAVSGLTGVFK